MQRSRELQLVYLCYEHALFDEVMNEEVFFELLQQRSEGAVGHALSNLRVVTLHQIQDLAQVVFHMMIVLQLKLLDGVAEITAAVIQ